MSIERTRKFLLTLPRVEETLQWDNLVYWVLDKAVGGKMFAMLVPEPGQPLVASFAVPQDRFADLLETEGVRPAPYFARIHWVAMEHWNAFPTADLHQHLRAAYDRVEARLPPRTRRIFDLSQRDYRALVKEKRAALKTKA